MSEYKELIRQFDRIRSYVRDFYVYGFKTREDFREKSGRTYDNHRRRMESWFSPYIKTDRSGHKKSVFLTIDSGRIPVNPLYQAWRSKTFTDNDISLRFLLPDLLAKGRFLTVEAIADEIQKLNGCLMDTQTIRRKLAFFEKEGLVIRKKEGRQYLYGSAENLALPHPGLLTPLWLAVSFFQGAAPFGFIGSTILDFWNKKNEYFRFHGDYLVHTLEDEILLPILTAMERKCQILLTVKSTRSRRAGDVAITPLRILTSTQTGRRYVCGRRQDSHRFTSFRLDSIQNARILEPDPCFDRYMETFADTFPYIWGVSFGNLRKPETVTMEICFDEKEESYILTRLDREGRGGALKRLEPGVYEYRRLCLDPSELLPWAKSFTGRVRSFHCSDRAVEKRFWDDMNLMEACYLPSDAVPGQEQDHHL